jgi:MFS transporter, MHS family, proline/betaine transporter
MTGCLSAKQQDGSVTAATQALPEPTASISANPFGIANKGQMAEHSSMEAAPRKFEGRHPLIAVLLGSTLEWFDFVSFGILAEYLARAFFRTANQDVALLEAFALFGVGFLLRPVGGLIIGWIGDTKGRKPAFLLTIVTMALGTLMIAFIPSYAAVGIAAPILLLVARLIQGFSAGGEWGVAISFLAEWSSQDRRGYVGSFLSVSVALGSLLASGIVAALTTTLTPDAMEAWGWRIPFLIAGLLGLVGRWMRANTYESPAYRDLMQRRLSAKRRPLHFDFRKGLLAFVSPFTGRSASIHFLYFCRAMPARRPI